LEFVSFWEWRHIGSRRRLQVPLEVAGSSKLSPGWLGKEV